MNNTPPDGGKTTRGRTLLRAKPGPRPVSGCSVERKVRRKPRLSVVRGSPMPPAVTHGDALAPCEPEAVIEPGIGGSLRAEIQIPGETVFRLEASAEFFTPDELRLFAKLAQRIADEKGRRHSLRAL